MSVKQGIIAPLSLLPHGQELQNYLITLSAAMTGKKKPPADYIHDLRAHSGIFVDAADLEQTIERIETIFREKGYRTPWDLENDLIRAAQPDMPEAAIIHADQYAASELSPDTLTGFYQKPQVPLTMALAALYTQSTGRPVSVIEIDFSNMRGTNEHFENIISVAEGREITGFIQHEAMQLTDQSAYITASAISHAITGSLNTPVIPLRTGGDEVRIVLPDSNLEKAESVIEKIHAAIEDVTARLDLHDHPHGKRPLDVWSNGFGASAAAFELKGDSQQAYEEAIHRADKEIQLSKIKIGQNRIANPDFDSLKPPGLRFPAYLQNSESAKAHLTAILERIATLREAIAAEMGPAPEIPSLEDVAKNMHTDHFPTVEQIQDGFYHRLKSDLQNSGLSLSPAQERILRIKANRFPAIDHATGTLMARDLPAMAGVALKIAGELNHRTGRTEPLWTIGASFHNLAGLNEALGHETANTILHQQAHDVLEQSLFKSGISRENFYLAHMGGGEFRAVIQPVIIDQDGSARVIDQKIMHAVCDLVREKTKTMNEKYATIQNPREELRPWENGITVTVTAKSYKTDQRLNTNQFRRGGAVVNFIGEHLAEDVQAKRKTYTQISPDAGPAQKIL